MGWEEPLTKNSKVRFDQAWTKKQDFLDRCEERRQACRAKYVNTKCHKMKIGSDLEHALHCEEQERKFAEKICQIAREMDHYEPLTDNTIEALTKLEQDLIAECYTLH